MQQKMPSRTHQKRPSAMPQMPRVEPPSKRLPGRERHMRDLRRPPQNEQLSYKRQKCASCKTEGHGSWSRTCPIFIKKTDEYNNRNPDNLLQYFPTADSWTWSANFRTTPSTATTPPRSNTQQGKRPQQQQRRQWDTYIPGDTYIPNYSNSNRQGPSASANNDSTGWGEVAGPSNPKPTTSDNVNRPPNSQSSRNNA